MPKDYIQITDDKGVERVFHNFTDLVAFIDSFTMGFLPDGYTYLIQEKEEENAEQTQKT